MKIKNNIPNAITILNLISGFVSVIMVLEGNFILASLFIFLAALFDFLDGMVARWLKAHSLIGKDLDSLADVISFGVAPGILMYQLLSFHCSGSSNILERMHIAPYFALLIPVCAAIRLAKFNNDIRQEESFIGLPTPANALFFASIPLVLLLQFRIFSIIRFSFLADLFSNARVLVILIVFFSYLMISDLRLFSMKVKTLDFQHNKVRFIFAILALLLLILFSINGIPMIIILYLILSLFSKENYI